MTKRWVQIAATAILCAWPTLGYGQVQDTLGTVDTLAIAEVQGAPGQRVMVPVTVVNDVPCFFVTIPIAYPPNLLHADSITTGGGRFSPFGIVTRDIDQVRGRLMVSVFGGSERVLDSGSGPVAWLHFTVASDANPGAVATIDTAYFDTSNTLLFVPEGGGSTYLPAVAPGAVEVVAANAPPLFANAGRYSVREQDSVRFEVYATDPEGSTVRLALVNRPPGALFTDLGAGAGEFAWAPPFTGPYSASGGSLELRFVAEDGQEATTLVVPLQIVNVNRPPELIVPDTIQVTAFDSLIWNVQATDPDYEPVAVTVTGLPAQVQVQSGNPLSIRWLPVLSDTGSHVVFFSANDGNGGEDECSALIRVAPTARVELLIDSVSGFTDQDVVLQLSMSNREAITGFELLFNVDPTAVTISGVEQAGTRVENWEMFAVEQHYASRPGDVRIVARADINDGVLTPPLDPGDGPIVNVRLHLIANENYAGFSFPVRFVFHTAQANTAIDAASGLIGQEEIAYIHGAVNILVYDNKLPGDINLNGLAFEVGDVVYLANYFSNPAQFPLSFEQRANSDANLDGTPATIADLVYMINVIVGGGLLRVAPPVDAPVTWDLSARGELTVQAEMALGGAVVEYRSQSLLPPVPGAAAAGMTLVSGREGDVWRCVLYALDGTLIDPGAGALLSNLEEAEILKVDLADPAGNELNVARRVSTPARLELLGNYPNPFNPATAIRFALPEPATVQIAIYDILGQRVKRLNGSFSAGQHELLWQGDDERGRAVSSGMYFYKLRAGIHTEVRRMLLLK